MPLPRLAAGRGEPLEETRGNGTVRLDTGKKKSRKEGEVRREIKLPATPLPTCGHGPCLKPSNLRGGGGKGKRGKKEGEKRFSLLLENEVREHLWTAKVGLANTP